MVAESPLRREIRDAFRLGALPVAVALAFGVLLVPRRPLPEDVPVPVPDGRALSRAAAVDARLADEARRHPLPGTVRALGSAVRQFHTLEAHADDDRAGVRSAEDATPPEIAAARRAIDGALVDALGAGIDALAELRAVQLESFLDEVQRFQATGRESEELQAVAGPFVRAMTAEGWCRGRSVVPRGAVLRAMYKHMWNALLGLEARKELAPSLDEERALYAFYLSHPHAARSVRDALDAARRGAHDAAACAAIDEAERGAVQSWRLERIARLAAIDPAYPAEYARGVVEMRKGDWKAAASALHAWLQAHPEGPLALRAQGFLRTAADAARVE